MGTQENVQVVKDGYAAFGRRDIPGLPALLAEDVEWQFPGAGTPLAGTYRGRDEVASFFQKLANEAEFLEFEPREFVAEGDRVPGGRLGARENEGPQQPKSSRSRTGSWLLLFATVRSRHSANIQIHRRSPSPASQPCGQPG